MNAYVLVFAVVIISAQAIPQGWSQPPPSPSIEANLEGDIALTGSGAADAVDDLYIAALGTPANPASIGSDSGTGAGVVQYGAIDQLTYVDKPNSAVTTLNVVQGDNLAGAADGVAATVSAGQDILISNAGSSDATGAGTVVENASTHSQVIA